MGYNEFKTRICAVGAMLIVALLCIGARFYHIQIDRHDELYGKAKSLYTGVRKASGNRGHIYDIQGSLLAGNIPCADIVADPQLTGEEDDCERTALMLSRMLGIPGGPIFQKLSIRERDGKKLRYAMIQANVRFEIAEEIRQKCREDKHKGLFFQEKTRRFYPKGSLLAQTLGFVNVEREETIPVTGLEKATEGEVASAEGKVVMERDRKGRALTYGYMEIDESKDGRNVYLTIDEQIQIFVEEELDRLCDEFNPKAAYAIMVDPRNGNIMAMAQRPTFDPNDRSTMHPDSWRNRMTTDVLEPGSTMKSMVVGAALDHGIVTPDMVFDCENGYWAEQKLRDSHRMGESTVRRIIAESSNIGTAKIATLMGKPLLYRTFRRFGVGSPTGIPLRPESTGVLRRPDAWDYLSISRFSIGQGLSMTPMQLVRAYAALASGKLHRLRLIDRLQDSMTGETITAPIEPAPLVFCSPEAHRQIIEMLKHVTRDRGTAKRAAVPGYSVAGKTGTSQKWVSPSAGSSGRGHYSNSEFFASFVGFVPADNPAFVLAVIVDEPQGSYYGGIVAAPAFREIAIKTLAYLNIPPDEEDSRQASR
ncbi:MAG: penicillin-binding protein 2 [Victivallales bacterium]|nr:penicillin-binding protein 2 [Victivallales bacterium]